MHNSLYRILTLRRTAFASHTTLIGALWQLYITGLHKVPFEASLPIPPNHPDNTTTTAIDN